MKSLLDYLGDPKDTLIVEQKLHYRVISPMFKLYSKGCEYAIRALAQVATQEGSQRFQAHSICEAAGIPESFTRKVFQALVQGGFLAAARGPGGGYEVIRDLRSVSLLDVILAVDGPDSFKGCIMGLSECRQDAPCPLHAFWSKAKGTLIDQLSVKLLGEVEEHPRCRELRFPAKPR